MAYAEQQQIVERYGAETLLLLAPRPDDAQAVDETAVARALSDAANEIDAYVGRKYDLPLDPCPDILTRLAVDIAAYRLADTADTLTDERRRRYEDATTLLQRIACGEVSLGVPAGPPSSRGAAALRARPRRFGRGVSTAREYPD